MKSVVKVADVVASICVKISIVVGGIAALGMVFNIFVDVALRFGFNLPIEGTNQYVSYWWMLPLVFFGLAAGQFYGEHTDLPMVYERLNPRGKQIMSIVALSFTGVFVALIGWAGMLNALDQMQVGEYDSATGTVIWPPRFAIPLACLAFLLLIVAQIAKIIVDRDGFLAAEEAPVGEEAEVLADLEELDNLTPETRTDQKFDEERATAK